MRRQHSLGTLILWALLVGVPAVAAAQASAGASGAAGSASAAAGSTASAATSDIQAIKRDSAAQVADELLKQAQYLQARYRPELARAVLQKLLAAQPDEPRALLMLGDMDLRENRMEDARAVLDALEQRNPDNQATRDMQSLWRLYTVDRFRLDELRRLHRGGKEEDAARLARELFLAGLPPASMYEEFGDLYRPRTQASRGGGGGSSTRPGRGARGPSRPWVETNPAVLARQRGYAALSARDNDRAEAAFKAALLRRPRDSSSLAGMGIVRLRQSRFDASRRFFEQAIKYERGDTTDWRDMARTARYWDLVDQARNAIARQQLDQAERLLESARAIQPSQTEATLLLAELLQQRGEVDRASALYDQVLRQEGDNQRALRESLGLSLAEVRTPADIGAVLDRAEAQAKRLNLTLGDLIDVGALRDAADGLARRGQLAAAQRVLERGVAALPADPWLRYDLARLYQRQGNPQRATALMDEGMAEVARQAQAASAPQQATSADHEMRQAAALIALGNDQEDLALRLMAPIDLATASDAQRSVIERARFEAAMRRYRTALASGDAAAMNAALADAGAIGGTTTERRLRVAAARLESGQRAAAQAALDGMDPRAMQREDALRWAQLATEADRMNEADAVLGRLAAAALASKQTPAPSDLAFRDSLIAAQARLTQRRIDAALAAGRPEEAQRLAAQGLLPWTRLDTVPRAARLAQAELWLSASRPAEAVAWLDELLLAEPDDTAVRLLRIRALDAAGRGGEARADIRALIAQKPGDADVRLEAARLAREDGDYNQAMAHLRAIDAPTVAATGLDGSASGSTSGSASGGGSVDTSDNAVAVAAGGPSGPAGPARRADVQDAIDRIEARRQPRVEFGLYSADRSARQGVDALHDREATMLVTWPVGYNGHVFGQLDEVRINAGTLPTPFASVEDFGKINALGGGADLPQPLRQAEQGRNVGLGWIDDKRRVDIGIIGINMPVQNVVGGWLERFSGQGNDYSVDVSRRPLTSSLLTYVGAHDPITGDVWGGVTQTGVTFRLGRDLPQGWSLGSSLRAVSLTGRNVESNTALLWRTAVDRDWYKSEPLTFNAGLVGNVWHYARNSNFSTFGQGNYYSPQRYLSLGVPLQISGRQGNLSYLLRGSVSRSWTHEDDAPYYPTDGALQAVGNPTHSGGGNGGGVGRSLRGALEYQLSPQWVAGAAFDIDRSASYSPNRATIYIRHFFKPQSPALSTPPNPVIPYSQY